MKIIGRFMATYMKGAWIMHNFKSVVDNDKIWFEILKEFMIENAKGFANTRDFFNKVNEKTNSDYWYFAQQYFYTPNQLIFKYYQTEEEFHYKWENVNDNFTMPIDLLVNGKKKFTPKKEYQKFDINKHSQIEAMDWRFYILPQKMNYNKILAIYLLSSLLFSNDNLNENKLLHI